MADADRLLREAEVTAFKGWEFTRLGSRLVLEPPPWAFEEIVAELATTAATMLDMGTGGGEWLSSLRARAPMTVATESWAPNVDVAAAKLRRFGVSVIYAEGAADNHRQHAEYPTVGSALGTRSLIWSATATKAMSPPR